MESNSLVVALSTDGGKTFHWLTYVDTAHFVEHPVIATGPGAGVSVSGAVSSATSTTLTDTTQHWTTNQWQHQIVYITSGTDAGDQETIISNTSNTLTVTTWKTTSDSTSQYVIGIYSLHGASAHLAFDHSSDQAYLVYTNSGGPNAADTDLFERYSTNNGATWSNPIVVNTSADNGTATSATMTTLTDTSKSWKSGQWVGHSVYIVAGTDAGDSGVVESNISTPLTLTARFTGTPDNTSQFVIGDGASQFWPTAVLDQISGALATTWYDTQTDFKNSGRNLLAQVFGAVSADGGSTFTETQISPTNSGSLDQSDGPITEAQLIGGGKDAKGNYVVTYSRGPLGLTDTTKDWIASPSPGWWGVRRELLERALLGRGHLARGQQHWLHREQHGHYDNS